MDQRTVAPSELSIDVNWSVQIFETTEADQALILEALDREFGDQVVALPSSGREHFVIVETANDTDLIDRVTAVVSLCSEQVRRVHLSAWPAGSERAAA